VCALFVGASDIGASCFCHFGSAVQMANAVCFFSLKMQFLDLFWYIADFYKKYSLWPSAALCLTP